MKQNKQTKKILVNIGISKATHLDLLELQQKFYATSKNAKKMSLDKIISFLINYYDRKGE